MKNYCFHSAPSKDGRISIAAIFVDDNTLQFGIARCNPKDNFVKKAGQKIALQRAHNRPEFTMTVKPEESVAKQFVNRCLLLISEPISGNFERGSSQYIVKEPKKKEAKIVPLRNAHDWDGDAITEEEQFERDLFPEITN